MEKGLIIYFFTGTIFIIISLPLYLGKIKRNGIYGVRIPATMKDDEIWYKANKKGGGYFILLGVIISGLTILFPLVSFISLDYYFVFLTIVLLIGVGVFSVKTILYANKLERDKK